MAQKILITGAAGFIGYHLSQSLVNDGYEVLGIDSINDYYDPSLKLARLSLLNKYSKFSFEKLNLIDRTLLSKSFEKFKPHIVVNLAAQAGVRFSISNPHAYLDSNLIGFLNILELCRHAEVEGFIYASSSSVYGGNEKMPFDVSDRVDKPISLYAVTKRSNELMAHSYSHLYGLNTTGLRFFTVYGPWGRPDMAMFIFADKISRGEPIQVFNNGAMKRDFTYIDDIVGGIRKSIDHNYRCELFNLGNNKSEKLLDMVKLIEKNLGKKAIIEYKPMQPGDVPESFADIEKSQRMLDYTPHTNIDLGIQKFVKWYKDYITT
jgi:UDP-glucuronate 4-epimerase